MRRGTSSGAWREANALLRRQRGRLTAALILVVANRVAALALPAASKHVVDEVIGRQRTDLLAPIAVLTCAAVALEAASAFGAGQLAGLAGQHAIAQVRRQLQERLVGLPLRRLDALQSGALAARLMADTEQLRYVVGSGVVQLASSLLTGVLALGLLFWLDPSLSLAVLVIVGLAVVALGGGFRWLTAALERVSRLSAEVTGRLVEVLGGVRIIKAYVAERREAHRFAHESHRLLRETVRALRGISVFNAGSTLVAGTVGALILVAGGQAVVVGTLSLGGFVMYVSLTGFLLSPVVQIAAGAGELGKAAAALRRIAELRALVTEEEEDHARGRLQRVGGTVELEDVSYGYVPGHLVLRGVSLHAPAGSITALVGPNGSGKSTLCRLLLAHDRPIAGRILIDGCDLAATRRRDYRSQLGVVLQDDVLFDGTISDSIRYGRPRASLSDVRAVARMAHCDEFVQQLPGGYSARVGERGVRLSAGQRQRIAVARALLVDPRILILDEATSSLDPESEVLIQDALRRLCRGRTTFVIAHRLSTVQHADQIMVLERGVVVEHGRHAELLAPKGRYRQLCDAHRRAEVEHLSSSMPKRLGLLDRLEAEVSAHLGGGNGDGRSEKNSHEH